MSFSGDINKFLEKTQSKLETVVKDAALIAFSRIVVLTPVDTGRARGNWLISLNAIDKSTSDTSFNNFSERAKLASFNVNDVVYITNSLPYILPLEFGKSKQAPNGMVRLTTLEFPRIVKELVKAYKINRTI